MFYLESIEDQISFEILRQKIFILLIRLNLIKRSKDFGNIKKFQYLLYIALVRFIYRNLTLLCVFFT